MEESATGFRLCYSNRLLRPWLAVLRRHEGYPPGPLAALDALDPDERVPIQTVHQMLKMAVATSGDEDIGLKASRELAVGDIGVLDYAVRSAPNIRVGIEVGARYARLINDALSVHLEIAGDRAHIAFETRVRLPRPAADFQLGAFHWVHARIWPQELMRTVEVCFPHPRPRDTSEYRATFGDTAVRFSAPFLGFSCDKSHLDTPLATSDSNLHRVLREHAARILAELPKAQSLTEKVCELIGAELSGGNPKALLIAGKLHMSSRTLGRRLEREGATFAALLDDVRRRLAVRHLGGYELGLADIAFLLGFSQTAAFHRAFKRWTGQTPLEYRRLQRQKRPLNGTRTAERSDATG